MNQSNNIGKKIRIADHKKGSNILKKLNQKGFTLIEIIAVLVILGILAAVAVPKYFNLQAAARQRAVDGAIGALQSSATQAYSQGLLNGTYNGTNGPVDNTTVNVGDFIGNYTTTGGITTVGISSGTQTSWSSGVTNFTKTFRMHD